MEIKEVEKFNVVLIINEDDVIEECVVFDVKEFPEAKATIVHTFCGRLSEYHNGSGMNVVKEFYTTDDLFEKAKKAAEDGVLQSFVQNDNATWINGIPLFNLEAPHPNLTLTTIATWMTYIDRLYKLSK